MGLRRRCPRNTLGRRCGVLWLHGHEDNAGLADRAADLRQQRRHPRLRRRRVAIADRVRHLLVGIERMRPRRPRHQPLVRPTAEDLRNHLAEGAEHVVAAGLEDQVVELDVGGEEVDEGAGLPEAAEIHRELGDAGALSCRRWA
jgi:hypothetical protein